MDDEASAGHVASSPREVRLLCRLLTRRHRWPRAEKARSLARLLHILRGIGRFHQGRRGMLEARMQDTCVTLLGDMEFGASQRGRCTRMFTSFD